MRAILLLLLSLTLAHADVGDPQIKTDHPWYPGELACSTFERLFATQAELYQRVVGVSPITDEQKALAAWLWRNAHYAHGEEGAMDLWNLGFTKGELRNREYWNGLFAHGFGLCGTTHSQWTAEMEYLLGHARGRGVGVQGHNSFEVFLTGGTYGSGKWVLLDHDISTVVYNLDGSALLSIPEVNSDFKRLASRSYRPEKQHGWLVCGLHPDDGSVFQEYAAAEYLPGYAAVPPMVHLRRGESLRRYVEPGLADGKTFVFWGRNYKTAGIPGPERSMTWVNQPEKMYQSKNGTGYKPGQARFANAVYTYKPDFKTSDYKEAVVDESSDHVTFEFYTPYIIAATPADDSSWGIYQPGARNGLVLNGSAGCEVSVSVDQGVTWQSCGTFRDRLDLTDFVKGRKQYLLRFGAGPKDLASSGLVMTTVCQANSAILPRLPDDRTKIVFEASNRAVISAGPNRDQARAKIVAGAFDSPTVTLQLDAPRQRPTAAIYAAAHVASGNPPAPEIKYAIDFSVDSGKTWQPMVQNWSIPRRGSEPRDFWSQSFCYGFTNVLGAKATSVQVRFKNDGGRRYLRAEAHLVYETSARDGMQVTFDWTAADGAHRESHLFSPASREPWQLATGKEVKTRWVQFDVVKTP